MSYVYASEPPTKGKVLLHTSGGDLEIELWPKESPIACRNFVQLCLEGYYNNTLFHRIIKKFVLQGGDPTGTGTGGESIYSKPFQSEFHSRLKFSHRGLLAMAPASPHENKSQFFFTLDATEELTGKNTIFGRCVGDTIFNLLKLGELETDADDRPLYPAKIIKTTVLANPFDDIVPRETEESRMKRATETKRLLDLENDRKIKPKIEEDLQTPGLTTKNIKDVISETDVSAAEKLNEKSEIQSDGDSDNIEEELTNKNLTEMRKKIEKLKGDLKRMDNPLAIKPQVKPKFISHIDQMRLDYLKSGRAQSGISKNMDSTAQLGLFTSTLKAVQKQSVKKVDAALGDEEHTECRLHFIQNCASCHDTFGIEEEDDDEGWMRSTLKFSKNVGANVYQPRVDDYTVIDPRVDPFGVSVGLSTAGKAGDANMWRDKVLGPGKRKYEHADGRNKKK